MVDGKSANLFGFAVLRHPIIDLHPSLPSLELYRSAGIRDIG